MTTWQDQAGIAYGRYQGSPPEIYERHFVPAIGVPSAEPVLEAARLRPGERVLDVACGTGVVARMAAEQVGSTGTVAGVDVNAGMLAVARGVPVTGAPVEWHEGNAEALPLPDATFDAALCSLGLPFVGDKVAALREMGRVLTPGGRAVVGTPGPIPSALEVLHGLLDDHLGPDAAIFVDAVFSLHDPDAMQDLLDSAGLERVDVQQTTVPLRLPAPADFLWQYVQGTPLAMAAAEMDRAARDALERDAVRRWAPFVDGDGMVSEVRILVTTARPEGDR